MPRINPLTAEARMDQQLLATIDKYKRLAGIKRYGDLGVKIGKCATTANCRLKSPGTFTLEELRRLIHTLRIPPEDLLPALYDKQ